MKQPRYRELRYNQRNKRGIAACKVCGKPIEASKLEAHEECKKHLLGLIRKTEGK